jgi:LysM repeat protein
MQPQKHLIVLSFAIALVAGCRSTPPPAAPIPVPEPNNTIEGKVVGDERTAMEAAVDTGTSAPAPVSTETATGSGPVLAPNAPDSYVVKRGDTLWGIAKMFLRDPWYWPEIWQVNPQVQNPHLIYPGDTLRLVYVEGQPKILLQRGDNARVLPRVRSEPLEAAISTIPYDSIAAFMSKPSVLSKEQIKCAAYVLASLDDHEAIGSGNTIYARGFCEPAEVGSRYSIVRVGDELRDPDDNKLLGYNGIYTATG